MDYFQGVVAEYLRANRGTFINPEFFLPLDGEQKSPPKNSSWYVDILAISVAERTVFLCEVTYSQSLAALLRRLAQWSTNWARILDALHRDSGIPKEWAVRPWIFIPTDAIPRLVTRLPQLPIPPRVTPLEMTVPWLYCTWDRRGENLALKPSSIPTEMTT